MAKPLYKLREGRKYNFDYNRRTILAIIYANITIR